MIYERRHTRMISDFGGWRANALVLPVRDRVASHRSACLS